MTSAQTWKASVLAGSILGGGHLMAAKVEQVADPVMGGQEALRLAGRLETPHLPLSPLCRLVRVLRPFVQPLVLPVLNQRHPRALGRAITRQLVGDHDPKCPALLLKQLVHQALGGVHVAPALHQDVQHRPGLVNRAPQPVLHARDRQYDFIEVSHASSHGQPAADLVRERLAELQPLH